VEEKEEKEKEGEEEGEEEGRSEFTDDLEDNLLQIAQKRNRENEKEKEKEKEKAQKNEKVEERENEKKSKLQKRRKVEEEEEEGDDSSTPSNLLLAASSSSSSSSTSSSSSSHTPSSGGPPSILAYFGSAKDRGKEKEKEKEGVTGQNKGVKGKRGGNIRWSSKARNSLGEGKKVSKHHPVPNSSHRLLKEGFVNTYDPNEPWVDSPTTPTVRLVYLSLLAIGRAGQTTLNLATLSDALEEERMVPSTKIISATSDGASNMLAENGLSRHKQSRSAGCVIGLLFSFSCVFFFFLFFVGLFVLLFSNL
jgi:hypothetical protein